MTEFLNLVMSKNEKLREIYYKNNIVHNGFNFSDDSELCMVTTIIALAESCEDLQQKLEKRLILEPLQIIVTKEKFDEIKKDGCIK